MLPTKLVHPYYLKPPPWLRIVRTPLSTFANETVFMEKIPKSSMNDIHWICYPSSRNRQRYVIPWDQGFSPRHLTREEVKPKALLWELAYHNLNLPAKSWLNFYVITSNFLSFAQDCLLGKSDWTDLCNVSDKVESFEMKDLTCMVFLRVLVLPHFCLQYVQVCGLSKLNQLFNMSEPTCLSYNKSMVYKICNQNSIQPIVSEHKWITAYIQMNGAIL